MIIAESTARMLHTLDAAGPLMWTGDRVPWEAFDLAALGLAQRGPADGSVELTELGRSYAVDVLERDYR